MRVPVPPFGQGRFGTEERVLPPRHQVFHSGADLLPAPRAGVILGSAARRYPPHVPLPIRRALPFRDARPGAVQVKLGALRPFT